MSLQYKTQVYIRKAIRQAVLTPLGAGLWKASLPSLGLEATGGDENEAEQNLLMQLTAYVLYALLSGAPLPRVEDIDLNEAAETGYVPSVAQASEAEALPHALADAQLARAPEPDVLVLTERESATIAEGLVAAPSPTPYLIDAAREYREFMGY